MEIQKEIIDEEKNSKTFLKRDMTTAKNYDKFNTQLVKVLTEHVEMRDDNSKALMYGLTKNC